MRSVVETVFLIAVLLMPALAHAQTSIQGQVTDASGAGLAGVTVVASSETDEADAHAMHLLQRAGSGRDVGLAAPHDHARTVVTDARGEYSLTDLHPGKYTVFYSLRGFSPLRRDITQTEGVTAQPMNVELAADASAALTVQGTVQDQYSPIVEWVEPSGSPVKPIHVSLLPSGTLFFLEPFFGMVPTPLNMAPPSTVQIFPMASPLPALTYNQSTGIQTGKLLVCAGHAQMADGNLFFQGGTYINWNVKNPGTPPSGTIVDGLTESLTYNTASNSWITNPNTIGFGAASKRPLRWYPTVTRLADSRMLLTGGYEGVFPALVHNRSVEVFDPVAKAWSITSDYTITPDGIANPDYTHVYQFPSDYLDPQTGANHDVVMMLGGSAEPMLLLMNGQKTVWKRSQKLRPGAQQHMDRFAPAKVIPNYGSSSAMLPLRLPEAGWGYNNGSLINAGGDYGSAMEGNIDVYDPGLNQWRPSIPMTGRRHYPTTTILPDGRILILAGHAPANTVDQTGYAEYIDPRNNFAHSVGVAHMPEVRGYHAMAILLPDGRVLVGGGNDDGNVGTEKSNFRYYSPDYMFKKRPQMVFAQPNIRINNYFPILVPYLTSVDEISLLGLGSMTHSFDMNQRSVQLRLHSEHVTMKMDAQQQLVVVDPSQCLGVGATCYDRYAVQAPVSRELAPPGYYMLFVLDKDRVPSLGKIVRLDP